MNEIATNTTEQLHRLPLLEYYQRSNVPLTERDGWLLPKRFHSPSEEASLFERGNAVVDFSDHGVLRLEGKEAVDFLNRITTNDLRNFGTGESVQTVLATEKGRVVDSITVLHREDHLLLIASRGAESDVKLWLEKFIIAEDLKIVDQTGKYLMFAVFHPRDALEHLSKSTGGDFFHFTYYDVDAALCIFDAMPAIPDSLRPLTDRQVGNDAVEIYNIERGIPQYKPEIMRECNPLELNLWNQISFTKGCYIGQEVIARLETYKKIQRTLCSFQSDKLIGSGSGSRIIYGGKDIGVVVNCVRGDNWRSGDEGLAVIRKEFARHGAQYSLAGSETSLIVEHVFERHEAADGNDNNNR